MFKAIIAIVSILSTVAIAKPNTNEPKPVPQVGVKTCEKVGTHTECKVMVVVPSKTSKGGK